MPFLHAATLFLADVHTAHCARNALQRNKNGYFATAKISVNRPSSAPPQVRLNTLSSSQAGID